MFLYQTPAISGLVAICVVQWRLPALLKPALPVTLVSPSQWCRWTTPAAHPRGLGLNQGRLWELRTQWNTAQKKPICVVLGEDDPLLQGQVHFDFHEHHLSTQLKQHNTVVWGQFYNMWGFSNLVENACLSFVDSWVQEPLCRDACLPCTVLCCFLHSVKLM